MFGWWRDRKRKQLLATPFPSAWEAVLASNVAHFPRLTPQMQSRVRDATRILVAERRFEGIGGFEITDEVKVTIAGQAALLLLGVEGYYFERLPSIIVRSESFARRQKSNNWMEEDQELAGLAAQHGPITLSWRDVVHSGRHPERGENLVLHEFAHHLDGLDGEMGGSLVTGDAAQDQRRKELFAAEFHRHVAAVEHGRKTLLDPYGAENEAEFFAICVECFYCRPQALRERHAELYAALAQLFGLDPAAWSAAPAPKVHKKRQHERHPRHSPASSAAELPRMRSADEYFARGLELWHEGNLEAAHADFSAALESDPNDSELWEHQAIVLLGLGRLEQAEAACRRALELEPGSEEAQRTLGVVLVEREKFAEALPLLDAVVKHSPDADHHYSRGLARAGLEDWRGAAEDFTAALKQEPQDGESLEERAYCREKLGDLAGAAEDRQRANLLRRVAE